eukprot:2123243-Amphidinium_carterae.1
MSRRRDECNAGAGNCSRHALATRPAQEQRPLSSKIANEVFRSLDSITFSFSGDASSTMTFRTHGFVRARSARSEHGTVVHLQLLTGTLTLDGSNIFLDSSLHSYLESLGLVVADQQIRAHGRRLQDSGVVVTGFFSFFEEFEFEALPDDVEKPRSPSKPYRMTVLERKPCKSVDACKSKIFDGEFLPGYDAATNSIATRVEFVETETWTMSIARVPHHPTQQLLTFTDHTSKTTRLIQFTSEDFPTRCGTEDYTGEEAFFDAAEWYVTYVRAVEREEATYELLDEEYTVPSSTNRFFHLISRNVSNDASDEEAIIHFEDDSATLMMKRSFIPNAVGEGWEVEEVIVLNLEEINDTSAEELLSQYVDLFDCGSETNQTMNTEFPVVDWFVFDESAEEILFYAQDFIDVASGGIGSYWGKAVRSTDFLLQILASEEEQLLASAQNVTLNLTVDDTDGRDRRLASVVTFPSSSITDCVESPMLSSSHRKITFCRTKAWPNMQSDCPGCTCETFSATQSNSNGQGWYGSGAVSVGDYCVTPGHFGFAGTLEAGYQASVKLKKRGTGIECSFGAYGSVTGSFGHFGYKCSDGSTQFSACRNEKAREHA